MCVSTYILNWYLYIHVHNTYQYTIYFSFLYDHQVLNLEEGTILLTNYIPGGTDALVQVNEYVQAVSSIDDPCVLHIGRLVSE